MAEISGFGSELKVSVDVGLERLKVLCGREDVVQSLKVIEEIELVNAFVHLVSNNLM